MDGRATKRALRTASPSIRRSRKGRKGSPHFKATADTSGSRKQSRERTKEEGGGKEQLRLRFTAQPLMLRFFFLSCFCTAWRSWGKHRNHIVPTMQRKKTRIKEGEAGERRKRATADPRVLLAHAATRNRSSLRFALLSSARGGRRQHVPRRRPSWCYAVLWGEGRKGRGGGGGKREKGRAECTTLHPPSLDPTALRVSIYVAVCSSAEVSKRAVGYVGVTVARES